jgi:hypothetical protein
MVLEHSKANKVLQKKDVLISQFLTLPPTSNESAITTRALTPVSFFGQMYFINCLMIAKSVAFLSFATDVTGVVGCFVFKGDSVGFDVNTLLGI